METTTPISFGTCRITQLVSSGTDTEVYRATQQPLGRVVAVKALKASLSPTSPFALRLQREAQVLSLLDHNSIARLLDYGRDEQRMWMVLGWVEGFSLSRLIAELRERQPVMAVAVAMEITKALCHAHERRVVHCDVQPANVLIGTQGAVTLVDFSSAVAEQLPVSPDALEVSEAVHAPSYMSPEQVLGEQVDSRTDIFAVGQVLYELLSGERPFRGTDERSLAHSVRHDEPPALPRQVPRRLAQIVAQCLQKLPNDRYSSAQALYGALEQVYEQLTTLPRRQVIMTALTRARLIARPTEFLENRLDMPTSRTPRPSVFSAVRVIGIASVVMVLGFLGIRIGFADEIEQMQGATRGPLPLVPQRAASLRVTAQPWAHVLVDGQQVETTPFATPIPLAAGVHHIILRHPYAPDEVRTIRVAEAERVVLDVVMKVKRPPKPAESAPGAASSAPLP